MDYKISETLINKVLQYLSSKPYIEVFSLIQEIQSKAVGIEEKEKYEQCDPK